MILSKSSGDNQNDNLVAVKDYYHKAENMTRNLNIRKCWQTNIQGQYIVPTRYDLLHGEGATRLKIE